MRFDEVINNKLFLLPKVTEINYQQELKDLFNEYIELISHITDYKKIKGINHNVSKESIVRRQKEFTQGILTTLDYYYDGKPSDSFNEISKTIDERIKRNKRMVRINDYSINEHFYRMRIKDNQFPYEKNEMFHIPFNLRHNVPTQRYSIPGFPSLYLGRTIYVCWEELQRPDFNKFQVSRFISLKPLKYLDLTPPQFNDNIYNINMFGYIMIWPLIAASSYKVKKRDAVFKEEYIIPQLLLQWVRNYEGIDGIKYNSTHIVHNELKINGEYGNLVLPVKTSYREGLCEKLLSYFEISDPISWNTMQMANGGGHSYLFNEGEFDYIDKKLPNFKILKNKIYPYSTSILGSMEYFLDNLNKEK